MSTEARPSRNKKKIDYSALATEGVGDDGQVEAKRGKKNNDDDDDEEHGVKKKKKGPAKKKAATKKKAAPKKKSSEEDAGEGETAE